MEHLLCCPTVFGHSPLDSDELNLLRWSGHEMNVSATRIYDTRHCQARQPLHNKTQWPDLLHGLL